VRKICGSDIKEELMGYFNPSKWEINSFALDVSYVRSCFEVISNAFRSSCYSANYPDSFFSLTIID